MDRQACRDLVVYYDAKIVWELFAKKSAECLNLRNSFITISTSYKIHILGNYFTYSLKNVRTTFILIT